MVTKAQSMALLRSRRLFRDGSRAFSQEDFVVLDYARLRILLAVLISTVVYIGALAGWVYLAKKTNDSAMLVIGPSILSFTFLCLLASLVWFAVRSRGILPIAIFDLRERSMRTAIRREQHRYEAITAFRVYFGRTVPDGKWLQDYSHAYTHVFAIVSGSTAEEEHVFSHVTSRIPGTRLFEKRAMKGLRDFLAQTCLPVKEFEIPREECMKEKEFIKAMEGGPLFRGHIPFYRIGKDPRVSRNA